MSFGGAKRAALAAVVLLAALLGAGCGATSPSPEGQPTGAQAPPDTSRGLPRDFVGLVSEDAFAAQGRERARILREQAAGGVRLLRQTFDWSDIEREKGQYEFVVHDDFVLAAARAGIEVMPIIFNAPSFHAGGVEAQPGDDTPVVRDLGAMELFAKRLVDRYGPGGSLWNEQGDTASRPVSVWQVWNEPNLPAYWGGRPSAPAYARMLQRVGGAIRKTDPDAEVVTGGIPNSKLGVPFRRYVRELVAAGAGSAFDSLAIHPYARDPASVVAAVSNARRLLNGLDLPDTKLWVTEFGWASEGPGSPFTIGAKSQATSIQTAVAAFGERAQALGIRGFVYFNWRDAPPYPGGKDFWGLHTGLLRADGKPKPALGAFAKAIEQLPQPDG